MSEVKYNLRNKNIQLNFSFGVGNQFRVTTGFTVKDQSHWNSKTGKIKNISKEPNASNINTRLAKLKLSFEAMYNRLLTEELSISKDVLREHYKTLTDSAKATKAKKTFSFTDLFIDWIEYAKSNRIKGKYLTEGTVKTYENTLYVIKMYEKEIAPIQFRNFDSRFSDSFMQFCEKPMYREEGLSVNNIGKHFKIIKTFLRHAIKNYDIKLPTTFNFTDFTTITEDVENIYLTNDELLTIFELDLSKHESKYRRVRDIFLIGAYTGMRVSDYNSLTLDNIIIHKGKKFFKIIAKKTRKKMYIPIVPIVSEIIDRGKGLPQNIADQTINNLIKEIGQWCGIDERVNIKRTRGRKTAVETFMKFELIQTHTARRSFCTNAYVNGMDSLTIMSLSGHKSERSFLKYIKVTEIQHAVRFSEHPYLKSLSSKR